jgi:tetratricopeptide (TPR) repeat protein
LKFVGPLVIVACFAVVLCASAAGAEPANRAAARELFDQGLEHARLGETALAAHKFEQAYQKSPQYTVLYNLGQAYALAGKPVEAIGALRRYLRDGGEAIDDERRRAVQSTIAVQEKRVGSLRISVEPKNAQIAIDGERLPAGSQEDEIALSVGKHSLVVTSPGFDPQVALVRIEARRTTALALRLGIIDMRVAQIEVLCSVPGVAILVDGAQRGTTPLRMPLLVAPGRRQLAFKRAGYVDRARTLDVSAHSQRTVDCGVRVQRELDASIAGRLNVRVDVAGAQVSVDGQRYLGSLLPSGRHFVTVEKVSFRSWSGTVDVRPARTSTLRVQLDPVPELAHRERAAVRRRRVPAYYLAGAGATLGIAALILAAQSSAEYEEWREKRAVLVDTPFTSDEYARRAARVRDQAAIVQRLDDWTLGCAVAGAAFVATGAMLFFIAGDESPYEVPTLRVSTRGFDARWTTTW